MIPFWNRSLLARLISSFLLLSLVVTGVAGIVAFIQATNTLEQSVVERLHIAAQAHQDELNLWINTQANDLAFVARWEELLELTSTIMTTETVSLEYQVAYTRVSETLRDIVVRRPDFNELFILNNEGMVVVSSQRTSKGQDYHESQYYISGRTQTFIQNVYPDPTTGQPTMTIAMPLLDSLGRRMGVLAVHLNLERMDSIILDRAGLGETGETYLIDETGVAVSSQHYGQQDDTPPAFSEGINRALAGESGTGLYRNHFGVPVIGAYTWLERLELALLVEIEEQEALAPIKQLALNIILAGIVTASILGIGVYILARQIARPILQLTDIAKEVATGNLKITAPVATQDEIGVLAQVFNQMTTQLRQLYEHMEQQVKNRTEELTQAKEEAEQAKEEAEQANRAKSAFLANMSHELRTPLSAIIGFVQLMRQDTKTTPTQHEYLHIVHRNSQHLRNLINDVLEMSKIEAGRTMLNQHAFNFHTLLNDVDALFQMQAQEKGIDLSIDYTDDVPHTIYADEQKLRQVLINLLSNAIKFTQKGGVTVRVSTQLAESNGSNESNDQTLRMLTIPTQHLTVEVIDTGPGIAPDELHNLFEVFVQTRTGQQSQEGTGLGLAICRNFAQLMGGTLTVQSEVGLGSSFTFAIPIALPEVSNEEEPRDMYQMLKLAPGQPTYRVLVVDDLPDNRHLLAEMLTRVGFEVQEACDGQEAIAVWERWKPHLIWMDIRMPVMDGYEATRRIKAQTNGQSTTIVALSASAFEEERSHFLEAGCDDFVGKPFRDSDILDCMTKHLGVAYRSEDAEQ